VGVVAVLSVAAPGLTVLEVFEAIGLPTPDPALSGRFLSFLPYGTAPPSTS
jgi:hypothetical protein